MENPSAESIKKRGEHLTGIVDWVAVGLSFIVALIIGVRAKSVRPAPPPPDKRSPIKGLLAFDTADEEVFARLQRHNELLVCATDESSQTARTIHIRNQNFADFVRIVLVVRLPTINEFQYAFGCASARLTRARRTQ